MEFYELRTVASNALSAINRQPFHIFFLFISQIFTYTTLRTRRNQLLDDLPHAARQQIIQLVRLTDIDCAFI